MAESIVSDIAVELISKLGSFAFNEIGVCWGLNDELAKLQRTVSTVEAVLLHAEEQSLHNPQVKTWLGMLSEALYDADDLLDEFSYEALHQQVMGGSEVVKKVRLFFSSSNPFAFGLKMGHKVKALRERLDEIAAEKIKFHLEERSAVSRSLVPKGRYQTHSSPPQVVIGREHDKEGIVRVLLSSDCDENVSVVSIVGIGGLGKTTLAQMVYNDDRVQNHFELNIWVCVSNDFDMQLLVKKILESITRNSPQTNEMDPLKNSLHEKINGRRYLLVLDDVWNQDVHKWSSFKDLLDGGARGSRIMITTRFRTVAKMSRAICIHELRGLSADESWSLFEQVALKQGHLLKPSLEAIGKEIVGKCCGVPLAIKAIGGVLCFKNPDTEWLSFKDNELSKLQVFSYDILPILRLSYNHLPSHYKRCFAYCSLYPKDFPIHVNQLIHLWISQGYIKSTNPNESLRDVGLEYFMDLFRSSFFQDVQMDYFGNIEYCYIHDLMHDLAVSAAVDDFSTLGFGTASVENTKHLSFLSYQKSIFLDFSSLLKAKKLRTLVQFNENVYFFGNKEVGLFPIEIEKIDAMFCGLRSLRVLSFSQWGIHMLPNSIVKLKHLRYLDLSQSSIKKLPNSITNLYNLQVLVLNWCQNLMQLPKNITKLVNLTDLDNYSCVNLSHMPRGIGKLTRLEKLSEFVIPDDHLVSKNIGGLDELHALNNLRGEFRIKNLRYVKNVPSEFTSARLSHKHKLQGLTLDWGEYDDETDNCHANDVANEETGVETLCPHPNLKKLWVWNYRGVKSPSWLPSLINLVSLEFNDCEKIQWLCYLNMERLDVKNGGGSSIFFPSLTDLTFEDCPNLKGFEGLSTLSTEELPCFPRLSQLEIGGCPNLTYLPLFPKLNKFYSEENGIESLVKILKKRENSASRSNSSPFSTLSELQHLCIWFTEKPLENNEFLQYFGSLQSLMFDNCSFKAVFSDEKDDEMQWQSLKVLRGVEFRNMENLVALPKGLQFITSLEHLLIHVCPSLECIPKWVPKLGALQYLTIVGSPQLEERCKNNSAEDWPNISHIPNIYIGYEQIQRNGRYLL